MAGGECSGGREPKVMKELEHYAAELTEQGYTIVEGLLDTRQTQEARDALQEIFDREAGIATARRWHTVKHQAAYMLPQKHELFRRLPLNEPLLSLMRLLLGERCVVSSLNGLTMVPGGEDQALHLDQPETVPNMVLTINAMHCLDDFTVANGATRVIPGSQNRLLPPGTERASYEDETIRLTAPAGSLIAFNGGLWHAGSRNTTDQPRRAIHAYYSRPWVVPQWNYPRSLSSDIAATLSDEQKRLFGYYAEPRWYDPRTDQIMYPWQVPAGK